ncbi:MAG: hypothetical protein B0D92_04375, partial [Spirochaeta sp. LUC14_002_19_P3]
MTYKTESTDWLIIGGGIHGTHIAIRLMTEAQVPRNQICILDPAERLLSRWLKVTALTGMTHLRSSSVHHLDTEPQSLRLFARKHFPPETQPFSKPYDRPSLKLFNAHSDWLIKEYDLASIHLQDKAMEFMELNQNGITIKTKGNKVISAAKAILAIGIGDQPEWPDWARAGKRKIQHLFDADFQWPQTTESIIIVGGGITAAQAALQMKNRQVHLVSRHGFRLHQFDSDPGWFGPKHLPEFLNEKNPVVRRRIIRNARYRGSMPPEVHQALVKAIDDGKIQYHTAQIEGVEESDNSISITTVENQTISAEHLVLATGFSPRVPGGAMV